MQYTGRDLAAWGVESGPWFKGAITLANELGEIGTSTEAIQEQVREYASVAAAKRESGRIAALPASRTLDPELIPVRPAEMPTAACTIFGQHDDRTLMQLDRCLGIGSATHGVLCADGHLGYAHPIGGVVAYTDHISISGVGFDIACGNMAIRLDVRYSEIRDRVPQIAGDINRAISFGVGRVNNERVDHPLFASPLWDEIEGVRALKSKAEAQLGTVGSGNHYVDLFEASDGFVWIGVHFGSRGLGHGITTHHLKLVGASDGMEVDPALVPISHDIGRSYIRGLELAGKYAYAGREWVVERVRAIIGGHVTQTVHNHHNWAWQERHFGQDLWVVRKGATPAHPGQRGFVGGSMGEHAVIIQGVDSELSAQALYSTVHGAGRAMSRTEARGRVKKNEAGEKIQLPGRVDPEAWHAWIREAGVHLVGGEIDEAPQAYKRLPDVLAAHEGTITVCELLRPFAVVMAGEGVVDPYKD